MDRRDRMVAGGLALALAVVAAAIIVPSLLPAAGSATVSPSPSAAPIQPYREGIVGRPVSVNPLTARTDVDRALVGLVFSGLLRLGPDGALRPDLASSWVVEDEGKTWLVRIAEDARWHDGEPVTSADVAFTVATLADPILEAPQGSSWARVTVETPDDRTVRFRLEEPLGGFPWLLTQPLAPEHLLADTPRDQLATDPFGDVPVGAGPFRMRELGPDGAVLEAARPVAPAANPSEPQPTPSLARSSRPIPRLDELDVVFYDDAAAMTADLATGAIDGASGSIDPARVGTPGSAVDLMEYPGTTLSTIVLDLRPDHPELRDARVRTALLAAIDRDAIIGQALSGQAERADGPIPPSSPLFDPTASPPVAHDPAAARKLLTDAGWKRSSGKWIAPGASKPYTVTLLVPPAETAPHIAETATAVADDWTTFGITTTVDEVPFATLVERLHTGDFTAAVVDVAIGHDPDLYPILASSQVASTGLNLSGVQDPKLDARLEAARRAVGEEARTKAYADLQAYLTKQQYLPTLFFRDLPFAVSDRLEGPSPNQVEGSGDRYWDVLTWRLASGR